MPLSLLCLIGLRRNQIERDNCVPVTFPPRQADTVGRRAPLPRPRPFPPAPRRQGRTTHARCVHERRRRVRHSVCANMCPLGSCCLQFFPRMDRLFTLAVFTLQICFFYLSRLFFIYFVFKGLPCRIWPDFWFLYWLVQKRIAATLEQKRGSI